MDLNDDQIIWSTLSLKSYWEELDFIFNKWGIDEADKFEILVDDYLATLSSGTITSRYSEKTSIQSFVISKQTTLFYIERIPINKIELLLFWNNQKDPKKLKAILSNL